MKDVDVRVRTMLEESDLPTDGSDELVELLAGFEKRHVDAVPEPSRELAVLLRGGQAAPRWRLLRPRHWNAIAAGVVALGAVVTTGLAAAANELPEPAQRWVSELSQRYLPFDLPSPTGPGTAGVDAPRRHGGGAGDASGEDEAAQGGRERHLTTPRAPHDKVPQHPSGVGAESAAETDDDGVSREVEEAELEDRYVGAREGTEATEETEGAQDPEGDTAPAKTSQGELAESDGPEEGEDDEEAQEPEQGEPEGSGEG